LAENTTEKRSKYEDKPPLDGRVIFYVFLGFVFLVGSFAARGQGESARNTLLYTGIAFLLFAFIIWKMKHGGFGFHPARNSILGIILRKVKGEEAFMSEEEKRRKERLARKKAKREAQKARQNEKLHQKNIYSEDYDDADPDAAAESAASDDGPAGEKTEE